MSSDPGPSVLYIPKTFGTASTIFLAMHSSFSDKGVKLIYIILCVLVPSWLPEQFTHLFGTSKGLKWQECFGQELPLDIGIYPCLYCSIISFDSAFDDLPCEAFCSQQDIAFGVLKLP